MRASSLIWCFNDDDASSSSSWSCSNWIAFYRSHFSALSRSNLLRILQFLWNNQMSKAVNHSPVACESNIFSLSLSFFQFIEQVTGTNNYLFPQYHRIYLYNNQNYIGIGIVNSRFKQTKSQWKQTLWPSSSGGSMRRAWIRLRLCYRFAARSSNTIAYQCPLPMMFSSCEKLLPLSKSLDLFQTQNNTTTEANYLEACCLFVGSPAWNFEGEEEKRTTL